MNSLIYYINLLLLIFLFSFLNFSCDNYSDSPDPGTTGPVAGSTRTFGNGTVTPFIESVKNGPPVEVGTAFLGGIQSGLDSVNSVYTNLQFTPTNNNTIYDHITVRWNPHGSMQSGAFSNPYVAVDFNMISENEQYLIYAEDTSRAYKTPPPGEIAADYKLLQNSALKNVGALYYDTTSAELLNGKLSKEFIYCFYNGKMVSHEIVFTLDYLKTVSKFVGVIKQPAIFSRGGNYPSKYVISYEPAKSTIKISLIDFVKH